MKSSAPITVVVLNLNGRKHLAGLLPALAAQSVPDFELVDNGSSDDSVALFERLAQQRNLQVRVIQNDTNRGFAPACNQAIDASNSPYVVMLNNDTVPEPGWLEQLVTTADSDAKVGMVASKMLFAHQPDHINSAGIALDWTGIAWDWMGGTLDQPEQTGSVEIFGPSGGAALYKRALLTELGGFDSDFFAYLEDVDLAWRAQLTGWRCLYQPQARLLHAHSATSGEGSPFKSFCLGRNKVWMLLKNYPNPWFRRYLPLILAYDLMASVYGLVKRRDAALLRGRVAGLRQMGRFMAKRRHVQQSITDPDHWRGLMFPIEAPWAVSARTAHLMQQA